MCGAGSSLASGVADRPCSRPCWGRKTGRSCSASLSAGSTRLASGLPQPITMCRNGWKVLQSHEHRWLPCEIKCQENRAMRACSLHHTPNRSAASGRFPGGRPQQRTGIPQGGFRSFHRSAPDELRARAARKGRRHEKSASRPGTGAGSHWSCIRTCAR